MLIDMIKYINQGNNKITLDSVLGRILNTYRGLDVAEASPDKRQEKYTLIMNDLTGEINNLVKDL